MLVIPEVLERLENAIAYLKGKRIINMQKDIVDKMGGNKSNTSSALNGNKKYLTKGFLRRFSETFTQISYTYLVSGGAEMILEDGKERSVYILKNEAEEVGEVVGHYKNQNNQFEELGNGLIRMKTKLVTQKASAGYLVGWGDPEYIDELPSHEVYVREYHRGVYRSFEIVGDSMNDAHNGAAPSINSIPHGSIATGRLVSRHLWNSRLHISDYQRFIIVTYDDGIIVKEIIAHEVEKGIITCRSRNPDKNMYPDFELDLKKVLQIFNVVQVTLIDK